MSDTVIVIGAGHNGLVAAALLARRGLRVRVIESRAVAGGLCAGEAFHPGYRHIGVHHDASTLRPWVARALQLSTHGLSLRPPPPILVAGPGEHEGWVLPSLRGSSDPTEALGSGPEPSLGEHQAGIHALEALLTSVSPVLQGFLDNPAPSLDLSTPSWPVIQRALALRGLGARQMLELMRIAALPVDDALAEYIPAPRLRAALALPALIGAYMGPWSPHSAGLWLLQGAQTASDVAGGPAELSRILEKVATHHGAEILFEHEVERIRIEDGRVEGVVLRGGDEIDATVVVSSLEPRRTLLDLISPLDLPVQLEDEIRCHRVRATSAKLHLALSGLPRWSSAEGVFERIRVAGDPASLERAFDAAKHRRLPAAPALDVRVPTVSEPGLAPPGHHVASVHVLGVPYEPAGGWSPEVRRRLSDAALDQLEEVAPGIGASVVGIELLTPPDLEARFGISGGHLLHGEAALDQLWSLRPGPLLSRHETPIEGLFLASGGIHPGGGPSGASGALAARAIQEADQRRGRRP